jgi:hypothetical protein
MNDENQINRNITIQSSLDELTKHRELQAIINPTQTEESARERLQMDIQEQEAALFNL